MNKKEIKKQRKNKRRNHDIAATTTSKDWGLGAISGKGGKTLNGDIPEGNYYKAIKGKG